MPMSQWPCQPDSLADIMDGDKDLIRYILAGAAEKHHLPLAIVDHADRYDPFNPRQQASIFCRHLRGDAYGGLPGVPGGEAECRKWDVRLAQRALLDDTLSIGEPRHNPCWLKLSDYATVLSVGGHRFVLVTGQLIPAPGDPPAVADVEEAVWENLGPSGGVPAPPDRVRELVGVLRSGMQPVADSALMEKISDCCRDIQRQFETHWQLRRDALEDEIYRDIIVTESGLLGLSEDGRHQVDWAKVDRLLSKLCERLGCGNAILFTHESHRGRDRQGALDNVLRLRASHGVDAQVCQAQPHFNWSKSRISDGGQRCVWGAAAAEVSHRGVRGGWFGSAHVHLWHATSDGRTGSRSVIGLGGFPNPDMVRERTAFLDRLLCALATRIHGLQLYAESHYGGDQSQWLAEFLAHQVRSRLQTFYGFQSTALRFSRGERSLADLAQSSARASRAMRDLATMGEVVLSDSPVLYNPDRMVFEAIGPWSVIEAAVEDQAAYAEQRGIEIRLALNALPVIRADYFWFRIMLGHLLNNAIKYSCEAPDGNLRRIDVRAESTDSEVSIYIEDFGLGILEKDRHRIFDLRGRSSEREEDLYRGRFQRRSGQPCGLYEAARIAVAHGAKMEARSRHYSGDEVWPTNIEECITTFIVRIPLAEPGGSP